ERRRLSLRRPGVPHLSRGPIISSGRSFEVPIMRVGIVAIQHESNTFLSSPTTLADFERDLLLRGDAVRGLASAHHEVGGFFAGLAAAGIHAAPVLATRAIPS